MGPSKQTLDGATSTGWWLEASGGLKHWWLEALVARGTLDGGLKHLWLEAWRCGALVCAGWKARVLITGLMGLATCDDAESVEELPELEIESSSTSVEFLSSSSSLMTHGL